MRTWIIAGLAALLLTAMAAMGVWFVKRRVPTVEAGTRTIAVLPLQNVSNDAESEFLRFALADEIANALTYAHSLEIRPLASTQKYANAEADPAKTGRELGVGTVVLGHFLRQDKMVMVTLEAVDVKNNRLVWTGTLTAPTDNLIALRNQMAREVRRELMPALGIAREAVETGSAPANREAYEAYLRTLAIPREVKAN
jgi:TolB-like protein